MRCNSDMWISAIFSTLLLSHATPTQAQTPPKREVSLTGEVRQHAGFESRIFGNKRNVTVYLPPNYGTETKRRYPVFYLHDGQNVFDGMTSYIPNAEWRADEVAEALIRAGLIEPIIIVGIDNAQADRANEYLPTRNRNMGGQAAKYGDFLVEEVMPFINKTYRTKPDGKYTALGGSSFGGIITACVGMQHPTRFSKLAIVSPSVWWDNRVILKMVAAQKSKPNQKVWIDMGTKEGPQGVPDAVALGHAYEKIGFRPGKDLWVYIDSGAEHNEPSWARRFGEILMTFFRK